MHAFLVLAFTLGVSALPDMPKADANQAFGSFPFMPIGSSAVEDDDGMSNPESYMAALEAIEQVQSASHSSSTRNQKGATLSMPFPTEYPASSSTADDKPGAVYEYSSSMSIMVSMPASPSMTSAEMEPVTLPMSAQSMTPSSMAQPSGFMTRPIMQALTSTSVAVAKATAQSMNIHEQHLASMSASATVMHAVASSSATPSSSVSNVANDATSMLSKIPIIGSLLGNLGGLM